MIRPLSGDPLKAVETNTSQETAPPAPEIGSGLACLVMMARLHGVAADPEQLAHEQAIGDQGFGTLDILLAAKRLQLQAKAVKASPDRLAKTPLPALAVGKSVEGKPLDFFILARIDGDQALIQSPAVGHPETLSLADLQARRSGELILFTSRASLAGELSKLDFTWLVPAIVKYRKLLAEVFPSQPSLGGRESKLHKLLHAGSNPAVFVDKVKIKSVSMSRSEALLKEC